MPLRRKPLRFALPLATGAALGAAALTTLVWAQPAPPNAASAPTAVVPPSAPGAPVSPPASAPDLGPPQEEAPPAEVPPPAPAPAQPIAPAEVAPAPPPKAQVSEKPTPVVKRARYDVAVLQALDKVTAETMRFEAPVGRPVRYKNIVFTVKACERAAPDEAFDDSIAYVDVDSQPKAEPGKPEPAPRQVFKGWMYASSPGLNPLQHPAYDAWVITCRTAAPSAAPKA